MTGSGEHEEWMDEVAELLASLAGKRVVGARVGECGFDLIFDDGSELEVYCIASDRGGLGASYGLVVSKYKWFPAPGEAEAREAAEALVERGIDASVVHPLTGEGVYVAVSEEDLLRLGDVCRELERPAREIICEQSWEGRGDSG